MTGTLALSALDGLLAGPDDLPIEFAFFYERLPEAEALAEGLARTLPAFGRLGAAGVEAGGRVSLHDVSGAEVPLDDKVSRTVLFDSVETGSERPMCRLKISRFGAGGCLGVCMSHVLGDGTSLVGLLSAWARSVRGNPPAAPVSSEFPAPPPGTLDGSLSLEEELVRAGYRLGPPPLPAHHEDFIWDIRRFSRADVEALLRLRDARASLPPVTVADVLTAFLWRYYNPPGQEGTEPAELGVMFDFRRIPGLLPPSYFGNAGLPLRVPLPPGEAATLPLMEIAARIRERLQSASAMDFFRCHALMEEVRRLRGQEGLDRINPATEDQGLLVNNLSRFDLSLLDFGTGAPHTFEVVTPRPRMCFIVARGDVLEAHTCLAKA